MNSIPDSVPLCIDLDGTLTSVDTLHEALLSLARQAPAALLLLPLRRRHGITSVRNDVEARARLDTTHLPFNQPLLVWLRAERAKGRRLVLLSAGDSRIAAQIAGQLGLFDQIVDRARVIGQFGERGFDYAGSKPAGEAMWRAARRAIVVGSGTQAARVGRIAEVERVFGCAASGPRVWIKAMRLHQWVKNMLIFVPALLAHKILEPAIFLECVAAFLAFGLCASSVYLVNDLLDLGADRQHPRKHKRPFASGELSARSGLFGACVLLGGSALLAGWVGGRFAAVLGGYYALTWAYSLRLKRAALVDVMTLAGLYTIRIIAGAAATGIAPSFWLLAFSVFIFLSLGFVKRYTELDDSREAGKADSAGRGYQATDLPLLMTLGVTSGYCTVVVMALYINSTDSQALYRHNQPLWLVCPLLLYWISRIWLLTTRNQMLDDPVVFALRDRLSLVVLGLLGLIMLISI
ncbi:MAG: UbiA family prenyltransferase [Gammaproteobacteria bacterium]